MHEHHLRYTFVRFGVPYVVSLAVLRRRRGALQDADLPCRRSGDHPLPDRAAGGRRPQPRPPGRRAAADRAAGRAVVDVPLPPARAGWCRTPAPATTAAASTTPSIRRSASRWPMPRLSRTRRAVSEPQPTAARRRTAPGIIRGATISASGAASRSANVRPASATRARTSARPLACRSPGGDRCTPATSWLRCAMARSCARRERRGGLSRASTPRSEHLRFRYLHMHPAPDGRGRIYSAAAW